MPVDPVHDPRARSVGLKDGEGVLGDGPVQVPLGEGGGERREGDQHGGDQRGGDQHEGNQREGDQRGKPWVPGSSRLHRPFRFSFVCCVFFPDNNQTQNLGHAGLAKL